MKTKKALLIIFNLFILLTITVTTVFAGNPHFVGKISVKVDGNTLTVSGKEAGLGNESQVYIEVSADAYCINRGGKHPKADNKESFSTGGYFPVQNGKANFQLSLTATFQPNCSPPMSVWWYNIVVADTGNGISQTFPGPYK
jgi:hypothetical protein